MKRYYLVANNTFYGVIILAGVRTILTTLKQSEATVTWESDLKQSVDFLEKKGIHITQKEITSEYISGNGKRRAVII